MNSLHGFRRAPLLTLLFVVVAPAWMGCHRDAGAAQRTSAASASPPSTSKRTPIPDADIAQAISRHLKEDSAVRSEQLQVRVDDGSCVLSGAVGSVLAKERALRIVQTLKGVRAVIDHVEVRPVVRADPQLEGDVMRALQQDGVTRTDLVTVAAKDGRLTLSGVAASWPERALFTEVAETVNGVKTIDNRISVTYALVTPEAQVAGAVRQRIANDIWLDGDAIAATITGRDVHLRGVVGSVAEKARARSDAWLAGVDSVDDDGVVVDWAKRDDQRRFIDHAFRSDEDVAQAVRDAFELDPRLARLEPLVEVRNGVVELTGTVDSAKARHAAELDAKDTVGVMDVRNMAVVQEASRPADADLERGVKRTRPADELNVERSPQEIKADIEDRLYWDATVERGSVKVSLSTDNVATLHGTLDSWSEIRAAGEDATLGGATRVINALQVRKPAGR